LIKKKGKWTLKARTSIRIVHRPWDHWANSQLYMKTYHALNFRIVSKYHDLIFLGPFLDSIWLCGLFLCKQSSIDSVIGYHRVYKLCDKSCRQGFA
jgi:hypothetical protein